MVDAAVVDVGKKVMRNDWLCDKAAETFLYENNRALSRLYSLSRANRRHSSNLKVRFKLMGIA